MDCCQIVFVDLRLEFEGVTVNLLFKKHLLFFLLIILLQCFLFSPSFRHQCIVSVLFILLLNFVVVHQALVCVVHVVQLHLSLQLLLSQAFINSRIPLLFIFSIKLTLSYNLVLFCLSNAHVRLHSFGHVALVLLKEVLVLLLALFFLLGFNLHEFQLSHFVLLRFLSFLFSDPIL